MKRWCQQNDNDDDDDEKSVNVNSLAKLIDAVNNAKMFCQQILSFRKRQELQVFIRYNLIEKCWETPERERKRERWWNVWQRIQAKYCIDTIYNTLNYPYRVYLPILCTLLFYILMRNLFFYLYRVGECTFSLRMVSKEFLVPWMALFTFLKFHFLSEKREHMNEGTGVCTICAFEWRNSIREKKNNEIIIMHQEIADDCHDRWIRLIDSPIKYTLNTVFFKKSDFFFLIASSSCSSF